MHSCPRRYPDSVENTRISAADEVFRSDTDLIVKTTAITQFEGETTEYTPSVIGSIILGIAIWAYTALKESSRIQANLGKQMLEIKVTDLGGGGAAHRLHPGKSYTRLGDIA